MISVTILSVVFDLLPLVWMKRRPKGSLRVDQQKMLNKLSQNNIQEEKLKEVQEKNQNSTDL